MAKTILDWDSPAEAAAKAAKQKTPTIKHEFSFESVERVNFKREGMRSMTFRPVLNPFLYFEYWNVDDPTNIRYGSNYYIESDSFGKDWERLRELGYSDAAPNKLRIRAMFAFIIIDRADNKVRILELPWQAGFLMGKFARQYNKDIGGKEGVDFTVSDLSDSQTEKYRIRASEDTPFTSEEKTCLKTLLADRRDPLDPVYRSRLTDIELILKGLDIDPFDIKVEATETDKEELVIPVPNMDDDEYKLYMKGTPDDVLRNLRILVKSKEYSRYMVDSLSEQQRINMDVFMIQSSMELEYRDKGLPFSSRFIAKTRQDYSDMVDSIDTEHFLILIHLL